MTGTGNPLREKERKLKESIAAMDMSLHTMKKRLGECEFYIQHPHTSEYDPTELRKELEQLKQNMAAVQTVRDSEQKRLEGITASLSGHEKILAMHNPKHICEDRGHHTWQIVSRFEFGPHRGKWNHRKCTVCTTSEKLGRGV